MKNIVLTGLMGCGKTTVANSLKNIFYDFELVEIDSLIEEQEKKTINKIFEEDGEAYFRKVEKKVVDKVLKNENQIISLGGGSLENNIDWDLLSENSIVFYLNATIDTLYERIKNNTDRPLLKCDNPKEKLSDLLKMREINYKKANFIVDVDEFNVSDIAKKIERLYKNGTN